MKKFNWQKLIVLLGVVLLIGGTALLVDIYRSRATSMVAAPSITNTVVAKKPSASAIAGNPANLQIPSLGMNLSIIPGVYNPKTGEWTLSLDKVQYATVTPEPNNESGATFLYGHYRSEVFARLHTIAPNSEAIVTTDNGHTFTYKLNGVQVVSPSDSSQVFNYTGKPILIIQTCTGLFFQNRQLFYFDLEKVS